MTGTGCVIAVPPRKHDCAPGWTTKTGASGKPYDVPPSAYDYPRGTVWACPCGKTWVVSRGAPWNSPISLRWRPESRLARWRRTRKSTSW